MLDSKQLFNTFVPSLVRPEVPNCRDMFRFKDLKQVQVGPRTESSMTSLAKVNVNYNITCLIVTIVVQSGSKVFIRHRSGTFYSYRRPQRLRGRFSKAQYYYWRFGISQLWYIVFALDTWRCCLYFSLAVPHKRLGTTVLHDQERAHFWEQLGALMLGTGNGNELVLHEVLVSHFHYLCVIVFQTDYRK